MIIKNENETTTDKFVVFNSNGRHQYIIFEVCPNDSQQSFSFVGKALSNSSKDIIYTDSVIYATLFCDFLNSNSEYLCKIMRLYDSREINEKQAIEMLREIFNKGR
ncbi:hypothetical protein M0R04_15350 [Candidatus Dojkabacteria bacterium]|jgi:hypothetical protein|nr:hypothetical protein [Candidatus Dojkabacteria bacterium]